MRLMLLHDYMNRSCATAWPGLHACEACVFAPIMHMLAVCCGCATAICAIVESGLLCVAPLPLRSASPLQRWWVSLQRPAWPASCCGSTDTGGAAPIATEMKAKGT
jgi:hypothetical protein